MTEFTMQLNSPITDEQWNAITDTELVHSEKIEFITPSGKKVLFQKVRRGKWKHGVCQTCFFNWSEVAPIASVPNFCPNCGADMRGEHQ